MIQSVTYRGSGLLSPQAFSISAPISSVIPKHTMVAVPLLQSGFFFLELLSATILDQVKSHAIQDGGAQESQEVDLLESLMAPL